MDSDFTAIVDRFAGRRVLLVGDFMLDRYLVGDADRISPEAPVPVLRVVERQDRAGGAGSVALNAAALGAHVDCIGLVGNDAEGDLLCGLLSAAGCDTSGMLAVGDRPTITKTRLVGLAEHRHRQQILRVDDEQTGPPAAVDDERLMAAVAARMRPADVVCLEDYAKGALHDDLCRSIIAEARREAKRVVIDPARIRDYGRYRHATVLTPNLAEFELAIGRTVSSDTDMVAAGSELVTRLDLEALIITLGRRGAMLIRAGGAHQLFPTQPRAVYDNTGAGDAVLAMVAVALAAGARLEDAVVLANVAGGLEVSKFGCVPIARDEVLAELSRGRSSAERKIRTAADLVPELAARRGRGETVVFTNGCFDILHPGHVKLLAEARSHGSALVVGVNSDASVRSLGKGDDRPLRRQADRLLMLAALECVDYVVLFDESTPQRLIEQIAPDVLVKGGDWAGKEVVGQKFVESRGGRVVLVDLLSGYSTTGEIGRIRQRSGSSD